MIQKAALFAAKAHEGMIRKGSRIPYIYHPMEVALIVAQMTDDPEVIAAAYLHDVLEDTSVTPEELEQNFGSRVLSFVMAESEDKSRTWRERKASTIAHLKRAPREVKLLTLGDKLSNMRSTARDYMVIGDEIWQRFNEKHRECHQWYLEGIMDGLQELRELPPFQELEYNGHKKRGVYSQQTHRFAQFAGSGMCRQTCPVRDRNFSIKMRLQLCHKGRDSNLMFQGDLGDKRKSKGNTDCALGGAGTGADDGSRRASGARGNCAAGGDL